MYGLNKYNNLNNQRDGYDNIITLYDNIKLKNGDYGMT